MLLRNALNGLRLATKSNYSLHSNYSSKLQNTFQPIKTCVCRQTTTSAATAAAVETSTTSGVKAVGVWLLGGCALTASTVALGGLTRLTESGLSMVDWSLIKEMKPPTTHKQWTAEFEKYQQFPEFRFLNHDMTLNEFKFIWYMEWGHRQLGKFIGAYFFLPLAYFYKKGYLNKGLKIKTGLLGGLLCWQGFMGWYMVKSGLEEPKQYDIPRVSQYRLAAHLGTAFLFYSGMLWTGLSCLLPKIPLEDTKQISTLRRLAMSTKGLVFLTALSGAFVAGLDAGLTYNSYPKMADRWIPTDIMAIEPKWLNIFENSTTVQFDHRMLAHTTLAFIMFTWWKARNTKFLHSRALLASNCMLGMAFVQVALGITTLLTYVPTPTAAMHQSGSLTLLSLAIWFSHELRRLPK